MTSHFITCSLVALWFHPLWLWMLERLPQFFSVFCIRCGYGLWVVASVALAAVAPLDATGCCWQCVMQYIYMELCILQILPLTEFGNFICRSLCARPSVSLKILLVDWLFCFAIISNSDNRSSSRSSNNLFCNTWTRNFLNKTELCRAVSTHNQLNSCVKQICYNWTAYVGCLVAPTAATRI